MDVTPKRAVGYVRVSTVIQAKEGESLSTQRQQITDFCKQKGWELARFYADEGISGAKVEYRTNFKKMIEDAEGGKFEVIVFTKLSRFARNARDYLNKSHELDEHGVLLASVKENIDPTTKTGKMIAGILALFAEWEHETIREQMHENKIAKWKDGRTFIGRPPYGYRWSKDKGELEINEKDSEVYHAIRRMYVEEGLSCQDISLKLKEQGIRCKKAYWSSVTVSYVLRNPAYYGHYVVNKYIYEDRVYKDGRVRAGTKRTKQKKPASEHITFPIPQLIDKSVWDQIQQRLEFNKHKSKHSAKRTRTFFLRDVLVCGHCGSRVGRKWGNIRKDGTAPRYYACYWTGTSEKEIKAAGRHRCTLPYLKADDVEKRVWNDLWSNYKVAFAINPEKAFKRLFNSDNYKGEIEQLRETIDRLNAEVKKKRKEVDKLFELREEIKESKAELIKDELIKRLEAKGDEILELEGNLNNAQSKCQKLESLQGKEQETKDFLLENKSKLKQLWQDIKKLGLDDRKVLVEAMVRGKIKVDYGDVDFPDVVMADFKHKFNIDILQRFMNEGKISQLDKNSTVDLAGYEL